MNYSKFCKSPLFTGTLLLTVSGLLSRVMGFFYRIFLSRAIGAEGLGIYQLIFPVLSLCVSFTAAGIQTSISKYVAETTARNAKKGSAAISYLGAGLLFSLFLSLFAGLFIFQNADFIAESFIDEMRCAPLLKIVALSLPFSAIHSCINGYYYGLKKAGIPSASQLLEQFVRCGSVYIFYLIAETEGRPFTVSMAVWGIVCGEISSVLFSVTALGFKQKFGQILPAFKEIFLFSLPLTTNRVTLNLFTSVEAVLIPMQLRAFGYDVSDALSIFGILTGMAMPMILFPSVLTNSVSVMLLPEISQARADKNNRLIRITIKKTVESCMILGFLSTVFFFCGGRLIGNLIFANSLSGTFIRTLSFICPFLYLSTTLCSILHGLGKPTLPFLLNLGGCFIRICFILFLIPVLGIRSYLFGLLFSHSFISLMAVLLLWRMPDNQ